MAAANPEFDLLKMRILEITNITLATHTILTEWFAALQNKTPKCLEETLAMYQDLTDKLRSMEPHIEAVGARARTHLAAVKKTSSIMNQMRQLAGATSNPNISDAVWEQSDALMKKTMDEYLPEQMMEAFMEPLMNNLCDLRDDHSKYMDVLRHNDYLANRKESHEFLKELAVFLNNWKDFFMPGMKPYRA